MASYFRQVLLYTIEFNEYPFEKLKKIFRPTDTGKSGSHKGKQKYFEGWPHGSLKHQSQQKLSGFVRPGLQIFQDWWAEVTHGAKIGGSFSEMMGPCISN